MNFVILENQVNHAVGVFLSLPTVKMRQLLTSAIHSVSTRLDILQSLVNGCRMTKQLRVDLNACVKQVRELNGYRNWLLHDAWIGYNEATGEWAKLRPRTDKKLTYQTKAFSSKAISAEDRKCIRTLVRLSKLTRRFDEYRERLASRQKRA